MELPKLIIDKELAHGMANAAAPGYDALRVDGQELSAREKAIFDIALDIGAAMQLAQQKHEVVSTNTTDVADAPNGEELLLLAHTSNLPQSVEADYQLRHKHLEETSGSLLKAYEVNRAEYAGL